MRSGDRTWRLVVEADLAAASIASGVLVNETRYRISRNASRRARLAACETSIPQSISLRRVDRRPSVAPPGFPDLSKPPSPRNPGLDPGAACAEECRIVTSINARSDATPAGPAAEPSAEASGMKARLDNLVAVARTTADPTPGGRCRPGCQVRLPPMSTISSTARPLERGRRKHESSG